MQWLNILSRHHNEWVSIVRSFGESNYAEDIVQEMYIRINDAGSGEKCVVKDEPNKAYIWIILKNTYINYYKEKNRVTKLPIEDVLYLSYEQEELTKHESIVKIDRKIREEISKWNTYDRELFRVHVEHNKSMRDISKGANISLSSIFNTLKNCKRRIRVSVGEDYEDYKNEDYERI